MWLQIYNYKNHILLINKGLDYNRFCIKITKRSENIYVGIGSKSLLISES